MKCCDLKEYPQYESIPYSGYMECPECGSTRLLPGINKPIIVGWCSTPRGYMMVFECQECFAKFRYHNCGDSRWDWNEFKEILYKKIEWQK